MQLQYPNRGVERSTAQGVRADQFAKQAGLVCLRRARRPHLEQPRSDTTPCKLPRRLASCEPRADYVYRIESQSERSWQRLSGRESEVETILFIRLRAVLFP